MFTRLITALAFATIVFAAPPSNAGTPMEDGNAAYSRGDFAAAREAWGKAIYKNPQAAYNLAILHESGRGGPVDYKKAFDLYERAARKGMKDGRMQMARVFVHTRDLSLFSKASSVMLSAVKTKDPAAIYMAGMVYEVQGVESKVQGIDRWYNPLRFAWGYFNYADQMGHQPSREAAKRVVKELGRKHSKRLNSIMKTIRSNIE